MSTVTRKTRETDVRVTLTRGVGVCQSSTGQPFLDHMLVTLSRHSGLDLEVQAKGDLKHHTIEDVAITLGEALGPLVRAPIARYAHQVVAMDDALVAVTLDAGGRPFYQGPLPSSLYDHFFRSLCDHARVTLHLDVRRGRNRHHVVEAAFKATGFALRQALAPAPDVFSTKGSVALEADEC
ncbi:MAG: imidazoleglycerol-phosphate dehydratase [Candidatus Eisenbacteria bacterium]